MDFEIENEKIRERIANGETELQEATCVPVLLLSLIHIFYDSLETLGVEIVEDFEDIPLDDINFNASDSAEEAPAAEGVAIDDPVKVYLKAVSYTHLCTRRNGHLTPLFKGRRQAVERTCFPLWSQVVIPGFPWFS